LIDNQDGTVSDQVTGLMWQKTDGGEMTWDKAKKYAQDCRLGGHSDWRLPTSIELFTIMDHGKHGPAMDTEYFPKTEARYWWSNATRADDLSKVWVVNTGGGIGAHAASETISAGGDRPIHVRCVRGDNNLGSGPRLKDNGDGTILDTRTGLIWLQLPSERKMTWEESLKYCVELRVNDHKDWRLPNIKELRSLSDDQIIRPSIDRKFFPKVGSDLFWSSTTQSNRPERAWYMDFSTGLVTYSDKSDALYVLALRDGNALAGSREKPELDKSQLEKIRQGDQRRKGGGGGQKRNGAIPKDLE
jgi:hypothetical protein